MESNNIYELNKLLNDELYFSNQVENQIRSRGIKREYYIMQDSEKEITSITRYIVKNFKKDLSVFNHSYLVDISRLNTDLEKILGYVINFVLSVVVLMGKIFKLMILSVPLHLIIWIILSLRLLKTGFNGLILINNLRISIVFGTITAIAVVLIKQIVKLMYDLECSKHIKAKKKEIECRNNHRLSIYNRDIELITKYKRILEKNCAIDFSNITIEDKERLNSLAREAVIDNICDIELVMKGLLDDTELTIREEIIHRSNKIINFIKNK